MLLKLKVHVTKCDKKLFKNESYNALQLSDHNLQNKYIKDWFFLRNLIKTFIRSHFKFIRKVVSVFCHCRSRRKGVVIQKQQGLGPTSNRP